MNPELLILTELELERTLEVLWVRQFRFFPVGVVASSVVLMLGLEVPGEDLMVRSCRENSITIVYHMTSIHYI